MGMEPKVHFVAHVWGNYMGTGYGIQATVEHLPQIFRPSNSGNFNN